MKTNVINNSLEVRTRRLATSLLAAIVVTAGAATSAESGRPHAPGAFERKGAQALVENNSPAHPAPVLPSELDIPEFAGLARAWGGLPKQTFLVNTIHDGKPAKVAVHEAGTGSKIVVCVHGLYADSSNWRYIAGALGQDYQLWLVDLPGCGASDSPQAAKDDVTTYSPQALADRVLQAVGVRLEARPDVSRVLVVGHSLGGMIVLRMFSDEALRQRHATALAHVEGLVLLAPSDVLVTQATPDWLAFLALNSFKVQVGDALGLLHPAMVKSVRVSFCNSNAVTREIVLQGENLLKNRPQRRANQAMMRSAVPWREFGKAPDFDASDVLEAGYQKVRLPCLIVWGRRDTTLQSAMGYKIKDQLPDARMVVLPRSMHLLPMERPAECAGLIRDFDARLHAGSLAAARSVSLAAEEPAALTLSKLDAVPPPGESH
jgi:pimeloyl-ACP methyl ester carboxylesterase